MADSFRSPPESARSVPAGPSTAEQRVDVLASYFENLDESRGDSETRKREAGLQQNLAHKRLGVASSLFLALRAKHPPTAAHSLRTSLACSSWAASLGMPEALRDALEIAALLHDVGKIGVPDYILMKPGRLMGEELLSMDRHRQLGQEILTACCDSPAVLEVIRYSGAWFDGSREGYDRAGHELPLGTRMLSIADAYDSMTTDHVYRRALSRERAIAELFAFAGTQFDPRLVREFAKLAITDGLGLNSALARRWLKEIQPEETQVYLRSVESQPIAPASPPSRVSDDFYTRLLDSMHDGVFFVSRDLRVLHWNRAAERLTGIRGPALLDKQFVPSVLQMCQESGEPIQDYECPVANAIVTGVQTLNRVKIAGRNNQPVLINLHLVPIPGALQESKGAAVILHDASSQVSLEERVQKLHERATQDPLTKVANRAEFDRVLAEFVDTHLHAGVPCSLIICDIDHFKKINDVHGHQAGDEALISFAATLRQFVATGDLVARYGGEEFVMLCASCDNATATERAEEIRKTIATTPQSMLAGRCITVSFGVTEIQGGDTPETMLRRADRALLQAKDTGRNKVVQLGSGLNEPPAVRERRKSWLAGLFTSGSGEDLTVRRELVTSVPLKIAAEKLKGFISDHHAEIVEVAENKATIKIDGPNSPLQRRQSDRAIPFMIRLEFQEVRFHPNGLPNSWALQTSIRVELSPARKRDRRRRDVEERSSQLLFSLKSYFMAQNAQPRRRTSDPEPPGQHNPDHPLTDES